MASVASRRSRAPAASGSGRDAPASPAADFEPQPLEAPLNNDGVNALMALGGTVPVHDRFVKLLATAVEELTESAGKLNDRAYERTATHQRRMKRLRDNGEEMDEETVQAHRDFQEQVASLNKSLDMSMRSIVDHSAWMDGLAHKVSETTRVARTQSSQATTTTRDMTSTAENDDDDDDDETHADEDDDDGRDTSPRPRRRTRNTAHHPADTPHITLRAAFQKQEAEWRARALVDRYARDNDYRGFRRIVYDAQNPGEEAPPMPHERFWFAAEEDPAAAGAGAGASSTQASHHDDNNSDSDIEIERERISIKCPITLLPFVEPVTSAPCGHSFERDAILDMLARTEDHVPFTPDQLVELSQLDRRQRPRREEQMRTPRVICPKCDVPVTQADLRPDPALQRRVRRVLAAQRRAEEQEAATSDVEASDDGNTAGETRRRPLGIGSSPMVSTARSGSNARRMKVERGGTVIPGTQLSAAAARGRDTEMDVDDP